MGISVLSGRGSRRAGASGASAERGARSDERAAGAGQIRGSAGESEIENGAQGICAPFDGTDELAVAAGFVADGGRGHAVFHAAETAAETLGELMASAPEAGLQRVFGDAKFLGRFSGGIAFHFAE